MVLLVMEIVALLVLDMPVTTCAAALTDALIALILFAVLVLPMVLLLTVKVVPAVVAIPVKEWDIPVVVPTVVKAPIILLEIEETVEAASTAIPKVTPPVVEVEETILPVLVPEPMVLPLTVPMFALPAVRYIPLKIPGGVAAPLDDWTFQPAMVFPCTLVGVVVPTAKLMPRYRLVTEPEMTVVPEARAALPPM